MDILFSLCEKETKIDFLEINKKINSFSKVFNAEIYIQENEEIFYLSPEKWINTYQNNIDMFIRSCVEDAHKILIDKKYMLLMTIDNDRYYSIYKNIYDETFNELDKMLYKEQNQINVFVARKIKEYQNQEIH